MTKEIPRDQSAEESVIGSLLIDNEAWSKVRYLLKTDDFFYEQNQVMWAAFVALREREEPINQVTVAQELARLNKLDAVGGAAQLSHLISICPTSMDIEHYANIVKRLAISRGIVNLADKVAAIGYEANPDSNETLNKVVSLAQSYRAQHGSSKGLISSRDAAEMVMALANKYAQPQHRLSWGFRDLDRMTTGMYPGELIIMGGRPSVGKTELMLAMAESQSDKGYHILFVSAEMMMEMILERKVGRSLSVSVRSLREHPLTPEQMTTVYDVAGGLAERNISFLTKGAGSEDIYVKAEQLKETKGLDAVFIDYLGVLRDSYMGQGENTNAKVGKVCKVLKSIATDFAVPVVCGCQLSRAVEYRDDKRPMLADLRDSGNIEQDADIVCLLYRGQDTQDVLEVAMAKHRQLGAAREAIKLLWHPTMHRYVDYTEGI